jgi:DNA polymerase-3 subunit delta
VTIGDLAATASALPFMSAERIVLVRGLLGRLDPRAEESERKEMADALVAYLGAVPPTTRLILTDGPLSAANPVLKWAQARATDPTVALRQFEAPKPAAVPQWLAQRARARGGSIEPRAAQALADALDREGKVDLRRAESELEKLLVYADDRSVTEGDVRELVTSIGLESIFTLMDALADRNGRVATSLLAKFVDAGEPPLRILALVARQVRLLAMTRFLTDRGASVSELNAALGVPPFVVQKLQRQARRFSTPLLVAALRRLAQIDADIKTGKAEATLALDLFVCELCGPRERAKQPVA